MSLRLKGLVFLWFSTLVFAAANSVIAKLGDIGAHNLIDGRNPISFCNVLFTGNLIAGMTLLGVNWKAWNQAAVKKVRSSEWKMMLLITFLSGVLGPTFFFLGLMLSPVINVVLISTLDIPLTLLFGYILLKERPAKGIIAGASLGVVGVAVTFFLHQPPEVPMSMKMTMINIGDNPLSHFLAALPRSGEICVMLGVLFTVLSVELSRRYTKDVPEWIYSVFRMIAGACIFFVIVLIMLGWVHFIDIFTPVLWEWMLLYGGVIIAGGLYFWHKAIKITESSDLAIANSFTPVAGIIFAYIILREIPQKGEIIGGIVILVGIFIALAETLSHERVLKEEVVFPKPEGFSGV